MQRGAARGVATLGVTSLLTNQVAKRIHQRPRPLSEAISSAGGVRFEALDGAGMLRACPGVFCAGEMIDWEAPTGGYLLTACFASGRAAADGALRWAERSALPA